MALKRARITAKPRKGRSKFGAIRTVVDGITFASRAEARYYDVLKLRQRAGEIADLELQPRFPLVVNGHKVCTYVADFRFVDLDTGKVEIQDVKGVATSVFRLKAKLMKAIHGITITEVRA